MSTEQTYQAFLLRLWRGTGAQWCASLEDPHTGRRQAFASVEKLVEYLVRATQSGFASGEAGPPASDGEGHWEKLGTDA
jgi:hypothetical protein